MTKEHDLKTWSEYYWLVVSGAKRFELRRDDRGFAVGDTVCLREWDYDCGYSGNSVTMRITYILRNAGLFGLKPGYVILQLDEVKEQP
jgi:hypothetical protein